MTGKSFVVVGSLALVACSGGKAEQKPSTQTVGILLDNPEAEKDPEWKQAVTAGRGSVSVFKDGDKDVRCVFDVKVSNDAYPDDRRWGPVELWDDSDAAEQLQSGRRFPPATFRRKSRLMQISDVERRFEAIICEAPTLAETAPATSEPVAAEELVSTLAKEAPSASPMSEETKKIWETAVERGPGSVFTLMTDGERRKCAYAKEEAHFGDGDVGWAKIKAAQVLGAAVCAEEGCHVDETKAEAVRTRYTPANPMGERRAMGEAVMCLVAAGKDK